MIRDAWTWILNNGRCRSEAGGEASTTRVEFERYVIEDREPITRWNPRSSHPIAAGS